MMPHNIIKVAIAHGHYFVTCFNIYVSSDYG